MADAGVPLAPDGAVLIDPNAPMASGDWRVRLSAFTSQPAIRRAMPALIGLGAVLVMGALYMMIAQGPQRILYTDLSDGERAQVVQALEGAGISYSIDNSTGAITVAEDDIYRARMLVASDAGLAAPQGASEMLDAIPLGSSRTLEGERLRIARERELMLTIREIDGIESVRVHLATPERSVFVRQNNPPSASVMVRLKSGRSLNQAQVEAIVNLVSGSVPGMTSDQVRVVDQNGRLLSSQQEGPLDGLILQREFEAKLREQVVTLLTPILGDGNFSSEVQVELEQAETTSARESYDQEGAIRSESERMSTRQSEFGPGGIPGATTNTPPPDAQLVDDLPEAQEADQQGEPQETRPITTDSESAAQRNYELGREVAVTSTRPGGLVKLSVAVAVSDEALEAAAPMTAEQLQSLITAAVGADTERGDLVQVAVGGFESAEMPKLPFYEAAWFATVLRYATALIAVLLVLFLVVRPAMNRLLGIEKKAKKNKSKKGKKGKDGEDDDEEFDEDGKPLQTVSDESATGHPAIASGIETAQGVEEVEDLDVTQPIPPLDLEKSQQMLAESELPEQVELVRNLAYREPKRAVEAIQRMIEESDDALSGDEEGVAA